MKLYLLNDYVNGRWTNDKYLRLADFESFNKLAMHFFSTEAIFRIDGKNKFLKIFNKL